ncbi:ABC transporter permease [Saccharopolyspora gloriosae]|uniref:ABC transporter permease n=1 Tax=Saccharopolyspora gloriosae TaxID=455344 RepID=UPI001FB6F94C|nr:ABC transporter permease [Saccharopolyspora gloriosae]
MNLRYDSDMDPRGVDAPTVRHQPAPRQPGAAPPAAHPPHSPAAEPSRAGAGFGAALRYEWMGLRTLRTPWLLAGGAVLLQLLAAVNALTKDMGAEQAFEQSFSLPPKLAALFVAAIGVNLFATDYRNRTIITTMLAVRSRNHIVLAKMALTAAVGAVISVASVAVTYLVLLPAPSSLVFTIGAGVVLYVVLSALFGLALAGLTRSAAAALSAVLLVPLLLELLLVSLLDVDISAAPFASAASLFQNPDTVSWWAPLPLLAITAALSVAATVLLSRRDA